MNIPEKWLPGNVDFFLNSHNIMHVLVVVAVYSMHQVCVYHIKSINFRYAFIYWLHFFNFHQATMRDLEWMSKSGCNGGIINGTTPLDTIGGSHHTELWPISPPCYYADKRASSLASLPISNQMSATESTFYRFLAPIASLAVTLS